MAKCLVGAAGGLSAADKAKLIPENLRDGLKLFEGTSREVVGTYHSTLAAMLGAFAARNALGATIAWGDGVYVKGSMLSPSFGLEDGTIQILKDFYGIAQASGSGATGTATSIPLNQITEFKAGTTYTIRYTNSDHAFAMSIVAF